MSNNAGNNSLITSATTGVTSAPMTMINEYAALIGIVISILSLFAGVYFKVQERRDRLHALNVSNDVLREELRQQLINEIKNDGSQQNEQTSCS